MITRPFHLNGSPVYALMESHVIDTDIQCSFLYAEEILKILGQDDPR